MGRAVFSDELPVVKNNNAILAFDGPQALIPEETGCIKCGMSHRACPFNLLPVWIRTNGARQKTQTSSVHSR